MNRKLFSDLTHSLGRVGSRIKPSSDSEQVTKQVRSSWHLQPMNEVTHNLTKGGYS